MNTVVRTTLLAVLAGTGLAGCSAINPHPPEPNCGQRVHISTVQVVDLSSYELDEAQIAEAIREQVGDYRLVTERPLWVPRKYAYHNRGNVRGIVGVKSEAAEWGCNLLVLVERKMSRNGVMVQANNEEQVWLVHAGLRETPR